MGQFSSTLLAFVGSSLISTAFAASCGPIDNVKLTFYGWHDNDPPSPDNAFNCGRGNGPDGNPIAGGTGTYQDPISFATATDNQNFARCAIVYVPSLRKYFRNEDDCAECKSDWDGSHEYHIDLWTGSNTVDGGDKLVDCENSLPGGSNTIINNAPAGLPVDSTPLYDQSSGTCYKTTFPVDNASGLCAGGSSTPGGSSGSSSSLPSSKGTPTTLSTATSKPSPQAGGPPQSHQPPSGGSCEWEGHCAGAKCETYNDCSDVLICSSDKTCVAP